MHLSLMVIAIAIACLTRLFRSTPSPTWTDRWQHTLLTFLFAPLLLFMTAVAVLCMGTQGQMLGLPVGWIGYLLALTFLSSAVLMLIGLAGQGWRSLKQIRTYPQIQINGANGRILETSCLFAAQIGFWTPELVISQGLVATLSQEQLDAVLTHEQAHAHHHDTFWFFWLGWIRHLTAWLPNTEPCWQELLLLRELRADRWAAERVDSLVLAETLLQVIKSPLTDAQHYCAAFGETVSLNRLEERIEALLTHSAQSCETRRLVWIGLLFAFLPLLTVLFHS
ncbi:MAG: M48 family metalloprotease [Cyanobacteria bacterium CRU_2_1]|nr:M48 family metalloprotease [Cyanobacteria bacterium CRU_2_1]